MRKDTISINLYVAETRFPLTIKREQEETIRRAGKLLDDKLKQLRSVPKYEQVDDKKTIIFASLSIISELLDEVKVVGIESVEKELDNLKMMLEDSIRDIT